LSIANGFLNSRCIDGLPFNRGAVVSPASRCPHNPLHRVNRTKERDDRAQADGTVSFNAELAGAARWLNARADHGDLTADRANRLWVELSEEIAELRSAVGGAHELAIVDWRQRVAAEIAEGHAVERTVDRVVPH
jgi:hypothetical protein